MVKYVLVTGGVLSGLGKGVVASSLGTILQRMGFSVTNIKIGECDLDLGNYERFIGNRLTRDHNITTGKVYESVIKKVRPISRNQQERAGAYLGKTVQVVPHIVNEIQERIARVSRVPVEEGTDREPDICVIELGGTVGDIESMPFIEALRQFSYKVGKENFTNIHVSLVPVLGEQKTKPTQQSVRELRALGLFPDFVACRCTEPLTAETKSKISLFTQVPPEHVFSVHNVTNIYRVPLMLLNQGLGPRLLQLLHLQVRPDAVGMASWEAYADSVDATASPAVPSISIAFVGKYTEFQDSYQSVIWALKHAAVSVERRLVIIWIESEDLATEESSETFRKAWTALTTADGILVPGGFGVRGIEGKIRAAHYARTSGKPYLGLCLGLQIAAVEFARNVLGWKDANSTEFDEQTSHPVVIFMPEISKEVMGGNMRLGARKTVFTTLDCQAARLYSNKPEISERHRHRYEVNPELVPELEKAGCRFVGKDESGTRMEILEYDSAVHPYFLACQFHPEFKSNPMKPSPLFVGLMLACWHQQLNQKGLHQLEEHRKRWNLN